MLCTLVLNDLTRTMNSLHENAGEQFDVLAVSFDPAETPELAAAKKRQYIRAYRRPHAEEGMHFLDWPAGIDFAPHGGGRVPLCVGRQKPAMGALQRPGDPDSRRPDRPLFLRDRLRPDRSAARAGRGRAKKISPPLTTRVLLYCFHYDPSTGRYGFW